MVLLITSGDCSIDVTGGLIDSGRASDSLLAEDYDDLSSSEEVEEEKDGDQGADEDDLPPPPWSAPELGPIEASDITQEQALKLYERDQLLWLRL